MAILLSVVFGLLVYPIHVAGLTLCDTGGKLKVVASKANNVFTCTGAVSTDIITWNLRRSNGNTDLATCTPASCNNPYKPQFEASRPAGDRSTLTVNGSTTSYLQYIQGQTIVCKTNSGLSSTYSPQQTQCPVDIVSESKQKTNITGNDEATSTEPDGETKTDPEPEPGFPVGVVLGVVVAVLVVSAILVVVVLVIRRRKGRERQHASARSRMHRCREEPGSVKRDVTPLSTCPPGPQRSVHENRAFQKDDRAGKDHEAEQEPQGSRTGNPDGLVYITVAFNEEELKKAKDPPPEHETTAYAGIDYCKMHTQ